MHDPELAPSNKFSWLSGSGGGDGPHAHRAQTRTPAAPDAAFISPTTTQTGAALGHHPPTAANVGAGLLLLLSSAAARPVLASDVAARAMVEATSPARRNVRSVVAPRASAAGRPAPVCILRESATAMPTRSVLGGKGGRARHVSFPRERLRFGNMGF